MRGQATELQYGVLLELLSQSDRVVVVEAVDGVAEGVVVLLINKDAIVRIIDSLDIQVLNCNEVRLDEGQVVVPRSIEHANNAGVVDSWGEDSEEVGQKEGLLLEVEAQGLVVAEI